jgi:exosortase
VKTLRRLDFPTVAVAFAWFWAARFLAGEWLVNEQYYYAWGVFPLALWSWWQRPAQRGKNRPHVASGCAIAGLLTFFVGELLRWHDPLWRVTGMLLTVAAALLTAALLLAGGGWPALRARLFPLGFAFTAVPWPIPVELFVTQRLLHFVTTGVVATANLLGIAALQRANVIEVRGGLVGLEAACSGVQSLQASLMAALFLGEFFGLNTTRRVALVFLGGAGAFLANYSRVLAITVLTALHGASTAAGWHDTIGALATFSTFALLYLGARGLTPSRSIPATVSRLGVATDPWPVLVRVCACGIVLLPLLAWGWFAHGRNGSEIAPVSPRWQTDVSRLPPGWRAESFAAGPREAALLRYSEREGWRLVGPGGVTAWVVHLWWKPGGSLPGSAFTHTPALCMPWAGWTPRGPAEPIALRIGREAFPALAARFEQDGVKVCALQVLATGGRVEPPPDPAHFAGRFARFAQLWRAPLQQVNEELLLYLPPGADANAPWAEAEGALEALLPDRNPLAVPGANR